MEKAGIWSWFEKYCNGHVEFMDGNIESRVVVGLINHIMSTFKDCKGDRFTEVLQHMVKFTVPTDDGVPHLLVTTGDFSKA